MTDRTEKPLPSGEEFLRIGARDIPDES